VQRLEKSHTLTGHDGCVNTIRWNPTGNKLVSGSDDRKVLENDFVLNFLKKMYR
jgi:WD repeat-containing protein 42A